MPMFQLLEEKLVHCDEHNSWYMSAQCHMSTGDIFYVLTHEQNGSRQEIYMAQYAAESLQELLKTTNLTARIAQFASGKRFDQPNVS